MLGGFQPFTRSPKPPEHGRLGGEDWRKTPLSGPVLAPIRAYARKPAHHGRFPSNWRSASAGRPCSGSSGEDVTSALRSASRSDFVRHRQPYQGHGRWNVLREGSYQEPPRRFQALAPTDLNLPAAHHRRLSHVASDPNAARSPGAI